MDPKITLMSEPPAPPRPKLTVEEFNALPLPEEEGVWYELLDGELVVVRGAPRLVHQEISGNLQALLRAAVHDTGRGTVFHPPTGVVLGDDAVALPDLIVVLKERYEILKDDGIYGAPDLLVEILSPGRARFDYHTKREVYERHGVREYWIVDPDARSVVQLALGEDRRYRTAGVHEGDASFRCAILPDLEIPLAKVWPASR